MRIAIFGLRASELITFRGWLIRDLVAAGHEVVGCAPDGEPATIRRLAEMGAEYRPLGFRRNGMNILADLGSLAEMRSLLREIRPDILLSCGAKPVIYGTIAGRLAGVPRRFAMIEGMGYAFCEGGEGRRRLTRRLLTTLYRMALPLADTVFVLNGDDRRLMLESRMVGDPRRLEQVNGTGIDLTAFPAEPMPDGPPRFLMIARLLRDKGVVEYVEAARVVRAKRPEAAFILIGRLDTNPASVTAAELEGWTRAGLVTWLGEMDDIRPELARCSAYVLPSYREGMPRTVLEAMATGRPVIATDVPGCRDAVAAGTTGLLVPPRDPAALAQAMLDLLGDPARAAAMAAAGRARAEQVFDVREVNARIMERMGLCGTGAEPARPPAPLTRTAVGRGG